MLIPKPHTNTYKSREVSSLCVVLMMRLFLWPQFICQTGFFFLSIMIALRAKGHISIQHEIYVPQVWKCPFTLTNRNKSYAVRAYLALINIVAILNPHIFWGKTISKLSHCSLIMSKSKMDMLLKTLRA